MWRRRKVSDWIDEFFSDLEERFRPSWSEVQHCLEPLVDVDMSEDAVIVTVDLPCVTGKDDISLNVTEDSLDLKADLQRAVRWDRWGTVQKHIEFDSFRKVVPLPAKIDPEKVNATFKNGILKVVMPKVRKKFTIKVE